MAVLGNLGTMFVRDKNGQMVPVPVIRGEDGGFYTPEIKDGVIRWVASRPDMPPVPDMNIGTGGGGGTPDAVQFVPQELTDKQQAQARENIGAARTYTLKDGETIDDAPEDADIVWDPENEGEGAGGGTGGGSGTVTSVNGVQPDETGNVEIETGQPTDEQVKSAVDSYLEENPVSGGGGISTTAINLLIDILKVGMFTANVSGKIESLQEALLAGSSGDGGGGSGGNDTVKDEITIENGIMTIISVGSEVSVADGIMTIL